MKWNKRIQLIHSADIQAHLNLIKTEFISKEKAYESSLMVIIKVKWLETVGIPICANSAIFAQLSKHEFVRMVENGINKKRFSYGRRNASDLFQGL